jgi:hypothetical protein
VRCIEGIDRKALTLLPFDGIHWEQNVSKINPSARDKRLD